MTRNTALIQSLYKVLVQNTLENISEYGFSLTRISSYKVKEDPYCGVKVKENPYKGQRDPTLWIPYSRNTSRGLLLSVKGFVYTACCKNWLISPLLFKHICITFFMNLGDICFLPNCRKQTIFKRRLDNSFMGAYI